jgi:putative sigma-54 modulation protein
MKEFSADFVQTVDGFNHMNGNTDGAGLVRQRPRDRRRAEHARYAEQVPPYEPLVEPDLAAATDEPEVAGEDSRIVKIKRFAIEPMFEEDAITRMEELGHAFFIFVNAENEQVAVLYRRKDGRYGLIEPAIGGGYSGD